jgi:hypothetical protein
MQHETNDKELKISSSNISFESIYLKNYVPTEYIEEIKKAELLLIPNLNSQEENKPIFPETTLEFLDFLNDNAKDNLKTDIAISDKDFNKLELHSATIVVATFIVTSVFLPIAINLVSNFLYDQAKKHHRSNDDLSAEVNIIVQDEKTSKQISYKGPVSGIESTLTSSIPHLFSGGDINDCKRN